MTAKYYHSNNDKINDNDNNKNENNNNNNIDNELVRCLNCSGRGTVRCDNCYGTGITHKNYDT